MELAKDAGTDLGVDCHRRPLLGGQRSGLQQDPIRDGDLSQVVYRGRLRDELDHVLVEVELASGRDRVEGDALGMVERGPVAVVDDLGQARDGGARLALELTDVLKGAGDDRRGYHEQRRPERLDDPD